MSYRSRTTRLLGALLVVVAVAAGCSSSSKTTSTTGTTAAAGLTRLDHRVGGGVADRHLHRPGQELRAGPPGHDHPLQLRVVGRAGHPDPAGCGGRRVRLGQQQDHGHLVASGNVQGQPTVFARNKLEIVVKPGNPLGINSLADLTKAKTVALCASDAPCGAAADKALEAGQRHPRPVEGHPRRRREGHPGRGHHR